MRKSKLKKRDDFTPNGETPKKAKLTRRQKMVLDFVMRTIREEGYPPTLREIGNHMGIRSTNGVNDHLKALERKGYLRKGNLRARALTPLVDDVPETPNTTSVPLLGRVAAGVPIPRIEDSGTNLEMDSHLINNETGDVFALRVMGDSMIDDGIFEGDFLFVRKQSEANNGDIVVAVIDDEVTVKRFYREDDRIRLQPANAHMSPLYIDLDSWRQIQILGIAHGLFRRY